MMDFKLLRKYASSFVASTFVFALVAAYAPTALAAPVISFTPGSEPEAVFKVYEGGDYKVSVDLGGYIEDTEATLYINGPKDDDNATKNEIGQLNYMQNGTLEYEWDGKVDGKYLPAGDYELIVSGMDIFNNPTNQLTDEVEITEETHLTVTSAPTTWVMGSEQDMEFEFDLVTTVDACVVFMVGDEIVGSDGPLKSDTYVLSWDGEDGVLGKNTWSFMADPDYCDNAPAETGVLATGTVDFTEEAVEEMTTLSFLEEPSKNYTLGSGNYRTTVRLEKFDSDTKVEFKMEGPEGNTSTTFIPLSYTYTGAGLHEFVWNGIMNSQNVAPGVYKVMIQGMYGDNQKTNALEYTLTVREPAPEDNSCAGFTDLKADYEYCDEVTAVKDAGLMVGNDDGTFNTGSLNRAEAVTVFARLDGNFDVNKNYCGNSNEFAFPDVPCNMWFGNVVAYSQEKNYVTGYTAPDPRAGMFGPSDKLTQPQGFVLLARILGIQAPSQGSSFGGKVTGNQWYSGAYAWADQADLLPENEIDVSALFTREDMARVLSTLMDQGVIK